MAMSESEQMDTFHSLIESHIDPEFAKATNIVQFMKDEGIIVFTNLKQNWDGIQGVDLVHVEFTEHLPARLKPATRKIPPAILEVAKKEFDRLRTYFLVPSTSPVASNITVASKATPPYVRICGDFRIINKYIITNHGPLPDVRLNIDRISNYSIFADIDLKNGFHQLRVTEQTSRMLSIVTPWGHYQSPFMQEGIPIASFRFHQTMINIFEDFLDWMIVIIDNLLILAHDYHDLYNKVVLVVRRCIKHNVFLKFEKSFLGVKSVKFFGFECTKGSFKITEERKQQIQQIPRPMTKKGMQSLLGTTVICSKFIPNYSVRVQALYSMTAMEYDWKSCWNPTEIAAFDDLKQAVLDCCALHYPDASKFLVLETDASTTGWGYVLYQFDTKDYIIEPIMYGGAKFSDPATRWPTIKAEGYSVYGSAKAAEPYLIARPFFLHNDHQNLEAIALSTVPMIVRIRIYLQSYIMLWRHVSGPLSVGGDFMSRMHQYAQPTPLVLPIESAPEASIAIIAKDDITSALDSVHGNRNGHLGYRATYLALCKQFPGHQVPQRLVADYVAECPVCQKIRHTMNDKFTSIVRTNNVDHHRKRIGLDGVTITPMDKHGMCYVYLIVVSATKLVAGYPTSEHSALAVAQSLYSFRVTYGHYDELATDPGSDIMSAGVAMYLQWIGTSHRVSLVDVHTSNGVEPYCKQVIILLRALVQDERVEDRWSEPQNFGTILFIINSNINSETSQSPYHLTFGDLDHIYMNLPETTDKFTCQDEYVKLLNDNLHSLRSTAKKCRDSLEFKRVSATDPATQNIYQPGDLVLFDIRGPQKTFLPTKLTAPFRGPYEVLKHHKNDVTCRHLNTGVVQQFHVDRLKPYFGTLASAKDLAQADGFQHVIVEITAHRGDPMSRKKMDFFIQYAEGPPLWVPWSIDLFQSVPYETYCRAHPPLYPLIFTLDVAKTKIKTLNDQPITIIQPFSSGYMDLRWFSDGWYHSLELPNADFTNYLWPFEYNDFANDRHSKIHITFHFTNHQYILTNFQVTCWGYPKTIVPSTVFITPALLRQYPHILPDDCRESTLHSIQHL